MSLEKTPIWGMAIAAFVLRIALFLFVMTHNPDAKFEFDSQGYLQPGINLVSRGQFENCSQADGCLPEQFRTPGYPLFLGVTHIWFRQSLDMVIFWQILMTLGAGILVYLISRIIDPRMAILSAAIVFWDPPIIIYSMMILSESLFLLLLTGYLWFFIGYMNRSRVFDLVLAGLCLTAAVYVRPVGYYLGVVTAVFILWANLAHSRKKSCRDAAIFFMTVYALLGVWHYRNHILCRDATFSTVTSATIVSTYATGMIHAYGRDPALAQQGGNPWGFYLHMTIRSFLQLMTEPGNFKYFGSYPLKVAGKIFGYPWMIFWLIGLVFGMIKSNQNKIFQFLWVLIAYFLAATMIGTMLGAGPRFRVPMVPAIAIISGWGWRQIWTWLKARKIIHAISR